LGVVVTPDGKRAYVANDNSNTVSVIETATNTVVATVAVGSAPLRVAVTPDGKHAYVTNDNSNTVSVIDTATNTVLATVAVGKGPLGVGIIPPPGVRFLAFSAKLEIDLDRKPNKDAFELESSFTLSSTASNGIHPVAEPVTFQVGTFTTTIPPGSFNKHRDEDEDEDEDEHGHGHEDGFFAFGGVIDGVKLHALIKRTGTLRYAFHAEGKGANLTGTTNPVPVMLTIGDDSGMISIKAAIIQLQARASASH
jgi:YVTN family beta-propeller protein